jgi:hypothetical protein
LDVNLFLDGIVFPIEFVTMNIARPPGYLSAESFNILRDSPIGLEDDELSVLAMSGARRLHLGRPPEFIRSFPKDKISHHTPKTNFNTIIHRTAAPDISQKDYHS